MNYYSQRINLRECARSNVIYLLLFALGVVFLTLNAFHDSVWYDESCSTAMIRHSFGEIWHITATSDANPPLYYLMLKAVTLIFGSKLFVLRLFSALGVLSLLFLGIWPVRRLFDRPTSQLFCLFVIFAPVMISTAMDIRMYSWAMFFVTGCALSAHSLLEGGGRGEWVKFTLYGIAGAYTHYYALLGIGYLYLYLLGFMVMKKQKGVDRYFISLLCLIVAYLPWVNNLFGQMSAVSHNFWIQLPTMKSLLGGFALFPLRGTIDWVYTFPLLMTLFLALIPYVVALYHEKPSLKPSALYLFVYLLPIVTGVLVSYLIRPVIIHRYLIPVSGLFFIFLSHALSKNNSTKQKLFCIVCLVATSISCNYLIFTRAYRDDNTAAIRWVAKQIAADDIFVHTNFATFGIYSYYFPDHKQYLYREKGVAESASVNAFSPMGEEFSSTSFFSQKKQSMWLINPSDAWFKGGLLQRRGDERRFRRPYGPYTVYFDTVVNAQHALLPRL